MDARTLSALRDNQELFMTDRVTVLKYTKAVDQFGGEVLTLTDEILTIGRIQLFSPEEKAVGGQMFSGIDAEIFLPFDQVVSNEDVILVGEEKFDVVGTNQGYSEKLTLTVQVKRSP